MAVFIVMGIHVRHVYVGVTFCSSTIAVLGARKNIPKKNNVLAEYVLYNLYMSYVNG